MLQMPRLQKTGRCTVEACRIRRDGGTQPRAEMDESLAREYGEMMRYKGIGILPPVTLYFDGKDFWMSDGFHRVWGADLFGIANICADVHLGTQRDAVLASVGANATHGKRRSNADKRRAVVTLLQDPEGEWSGWSDGRIAEVCFVDAKTVGNIRDDLAKETGQEFPEVRVGRDGKAYNVAHIGQRESRQAVETVTLHADKWYPVNHQAQAIHDDPFDRQRDGRADRRYAQGFAIQQGKLIVEGIAQDGNYARYEIVPPLEEADEADVETDDLGPLFEHRQESPEAPAPPAPAEALPALRYQVGMKAICRHCERIYKIKSNVYDTWQPDKERGIWRCPYGHRLADVLMKIVRDEEVPRPEPGPAAQEGASDDDGSDKAEIYRALNADSALKASYDRLKAYSPGAAHRVMRIACDFQIEAGRMAALACLDVIRTEERAVSELKAARKEIEELRILLKKNGIKPFKSAPVP